VIGGVLAALATFYLLPRAGDLDVVRSQVADHAATVERVQGRVAALEGTDADTRERVATLETAANAAPEPHQVAGQIAQADARLTALEDKVGALDAAGADQGDSRRLAALENELSSLSTTVAGLRQSAGAAAAPASSQIPGRITDLEQRLGQDAGAADRVTALSGKIDALSGQVTSGGAQTEAVAKDVAALTGRVTQLSEQAATLAVEVGALQARVVSAEERISAAGNQSGRAATLALLAGQLEAAIDQAQAYEAPLESLRALGGDDAVIGEAAAKLAPGATSGVPSLAELRRSFAPTANDIVHAARAPDGDSVLDRAAGNLMRLVTVRPVGADAEGDDPAARVARAEAKLADGDLAGAVTELQGLEGPAAEAAAPWLERAQAHLAAQDALDSLRTHTTGLLAPSQ
jgi:hypothetical protein